MEQQSWLILVNTFEGEITEYIVNTSFGKD